MHAPMRRHTANGDVLLLTVIPSICLQLPGPLAHLGAPPHKPRGQLLDIQLGDAQAHFASHKGTAGELRTVSFFSVSLEPRSDLMYYAWAPNTALSPSCFVLRF